MYEKTHKGVYVKGFSTIKNGSGLLIASKKIYHHVSLDLITVSHGNVISVSKALSHLARIKI